MIFFVYSDQDSMYFVFAESEEMALQLLREEEPETKFFREYLESFEIQEGVIGPINRP